MENYHGDLADIVVRATGGEGRDTAAAEWQFLTNPVNFSSPDPSEDFGHPFTHLRDPLLVDIDGTTTNVAAATTATIIPAPAVSGFGTAGSLDLLDHNKNIEVDEMKNNNIFSRMLQISPNAKLTAPCSPSSMLVPPSSNIIVDHHRRHHHHNHQSLMISSNLISKAESTAGLQISSPRNTGIKRRKSQANNKVVCIPAPAPANSRPSGEVVPSDLWAWRKYGQKPIKGSPYPRGYYRCSSSKGCSARKQVERSRTDPNMLVITYTSEHNHPWPTQRNALAGSTRTHQPTKNNTTKNSSQPQKPKEEQKETTSTTDQNTTKAVKEEEMDQEFDHNHLDQMDDAEFDHKGLPQSYNSEDSFFADLGEIESTDPLELLFTQGFSGGDGGGGDDRDNNKSLDPFSFYDWVGNTSSTSTIATTTTTTTTTSYGSEAKRDS